MLARIQSLLTRFKHINKIDKFFVQDTAQLEFEIQKTEEELAKIINDFMVAQLKRRNNGTGRTNRKY